jgi:hypothetical protein
MDYDTDDHSGSLDGVIWHDERPYKVWRRSPIDKLAIQINETDKYLLTFKRMRQAELDEYRKFMDNSNRQWLFIAYIAWLCMTKCELLPDKTPGLFLIPEPFMGFIPKLDRLPASCRDAIFKSVLEANPFINKRNGKVEFKDTWTYTLKE